SRVAALRRRRPRGGGLARVPERARARSEHRPKRDDRTRARRLCRCSGWQDVIPILQRDGFNVIAVQNPLSSLAGEVAWTRRVIEDQSGPVVVVGHSYGGAVITGAAAGNPNVR